MKVFQLPILGPDGKALPKWRTYDPPAPYKVCPAEVIPLVPQQAVPVQSDAPAEGSEVTAPAIPAR